MPWNPPSADRREFESRPVRGGYTHAVRSGALSDWLVWGAGALAFIVAVAILWWGLFGDRARGRRRCPRCWYDMSHSNGLRCSECGRTAPNEKHLLRTRRRLFPALLAAIVASVGASYAIERGNQRGWLALMPTRVVMMSLPFSGDSYASLTSELTMRIGRRVMTDGQVRSLVKRCLRGDMLARPVSPEWERKYGTLLANCRGVVPKEFGLDEELLKLPAHIKLTSRRSWPEDAPICLRLDVREWWPAGTECRVTLTPQWDPDDPITIWRDAAPRSPARPGSRNRNPPRVYPLVIHDPPGSTRLEFDVVLERLVPGENSPTWEEIQAEAITVDVKLAGTLADTLQPSANEQLRAAMENTFRTVTKWTSGRSPVRVRFDRRPSYNVQTQEDVMIGAVVDIMHAGTLARRLELWWPQRATARNDYEYVVAYEDEELIKDAAENDQWQLLVRGDPAVALRAGNGTTYWAGEFTLPLIIDPIETVAPRKYWWREQGGVSQ